jgi:hypothetical protein
VAAGLTDALLSWLRLVESDHLTELQERRSAPRWPTEEPATMRAGDRMLQVRLHDLSEGGLCATAGSATGLSVGARVQVSLKVDGGLQLTAEVVRVGTGPHHAGDLAVRFVDVPMSTTTRLRAHLSQLEQRAHQREAAAWKAEAAARKGPVARA